MVCELDFDVSAARRPHPGRERLAVGTYLRGAVEPVFARLDMPTRLAGSAPHGCQRIAGAEGHGVVRGILLHDVEGMADRDAKPSPLSDGVVLVSFVHRKFIAIGIEHAALLEAFGVSPLKQASVVVVGNETDLLRVRFGVNAESERLGLFADLLFGEFANWKHQLVESSRSHSRHATRTKEHIGLILLRVGRSAEASVLG